MKKIAIQGHEGSFHHIVSKEYFGEDIQMEYCYTFREVARKVESAQVDFGVMAIENSIAGSIISNYSILQNHRLQVVGEAYLKITHNLMVLPDVELEDIEEVHSHQMALLQCTDFLDEHNWRLIETSDTARSAQKIALEGIRNAAAIAPEGVADMYGLKIVAKQINTIKNNYTRFVIIKRHDLITPPGANKASLYFKISHKKGSLVKVLEQMKDSAINLSKLQSYPIPDEPWNYLFHADIEFDSLEDYSRVLDKMQVASEGVYVYGVYKNGR